MAALIHHCHHPTADSAALPRRSFTPLPSPSFISRLSHSPSYFLCNALSSQPLLIPEPLETPQPLRNNELSQLLKLSVDYSDIHLQKAVHASILRIQHDIRLLNSLITSYVRIGNLSYAERVFKSIPDPDVVSYTAMISGLEKSNQEIEALELFYEMRQSDVEFNGYTLVVLLTVCKHLLDFELGFQIHGLSIKSGYFNCSHVGNALMGLYGEFNCLDSVIKVFDEMPQKDIASWNTMISCLIKEGFYDTALELFNDMLVIDGFRMDFFTLSSLLVASTSCHLMELGTGIHAYALKTGYGSNLSVNNALIEFYSKCGCVEDVETLFHRMPLHDAFTWTEMINAYMGFGLVYSAVDIFKKIPEKNSISYNALLTGLCQNGEGFRALVLFNKMVEEGVELTDFTLSCILRAGGILKDSKIGEMLHAFVHKIDFGDNDCIQTALLDMYTRCGRMDDAEKMYYRLSFEQRSLVMVTTMICAYARNAEADKAVSLIQELDIMDEVALASILGVCGELGFQTLGEQFHCYGLKHRFLSNVGVGNAVISMYAKCGDIEQARKVFNDMPAHDIVSWNSLLSGHIFNRQGEEALELWEEMQKNGVQPDTVACVLIISAYRHTKSNLVEQCRNFLQSMKSEYRIEPNSDHYAGLVGVFGYWGLLEQAEELIEDIPYEPKASVWTALLDGCRLHRNTTIGRRAVKKILSMKPDDPSTYILQSNLFSASGRWQCSESVREEMKARGFQKFPARSWIIHRNEVHSFYGRDKSHPESKSINSALDILLKECLKAGYKPDTSFVLHDVEEHQKWNFLLYHSGKLAVAYGLLVNGPRKTVRVMKNVRLCGDCHTFVKYVSLLTKREIVVRDASGFHCFANGECSCKDCW